MEQTLRAGADKPMGGGSFPNERQKRKPKSITISKIVNGYLVSPQGIYIEDGVVSQYVEKVEDLGKVVEEFFITEF